MTAYEGFTATVELAPDELVLLRKRVKLTGLLPEWRIPTAAITGVALKPATRLTNGHLQFEVSGRSSGKAAPDDPCTVVFTRKQGPGFDALAVQLAEIAKENLAAATLPEVIEVQGSRSARRAVKTQTAAHAKVEFPSTRATVRDALAEVREEQADTFKGITITADEIRSDEGSGPLAGAQAQVDAAGNITFRSTLTRTVLLPGLSGLAFQKREDQRELYLVIEGDGFSIVKKLDATREGEQARKFAARLNAAARGAQPNQGNALIPSGSPTDALAELVKLKDMGLISEAEFAAKKTEVLGRI